MKEADGREVCHKYNKGLCEDDGCPRNHVCAYCGGKRRSKDKSCSKSKQFHDIDFPGKGKKGGPKGKNKQ